MKGGDRPFTFLLNVNAFADTNPSDNQEGEGIILEIDSSSNPTTDLYPK